MIVNKELFIQNIKVGRIFFFSDNRLIKTSKPHPFVVAGIQDKKLIFFFACTSQEKTANKLAIRCEKPENTLVPIYPDSNNKLDKDCTFIDCNRVFEYTLDNLYLKYSTNAVKDYREVKLHELQQILDGALNSQLLKGTEQDVIENSIKNVLL